jgi:hypothetical protein
VSGAGALAIVGLGSLALWGLSRGLDRLQYRLSEPSEQERLEIAYRQARSDLLREGRRGRHIHPDRTIEALARLESTREKLRAMRRSL